MTEFGGGYGPDFLGNSILLHIGKKMYVLIGQSIYLFESLNKIVDFKSPVGNSDVPYSYAIDIKGFIYLLTSNVVMAPNYDLNKYLSDKWHDPSIYYYKHKLMTADHAYKPPEEPIHNFENIKEFHIGNDPYTLTYEPYVKGEYERLKKDFKGADKHGISIVHQDGTRKQLTKKMYTDMMDRFGKMMGFQKLNIILLLYHRM